MAIEKIKILAAVLELPDKLHCQYSPIGQVLQLVGWIGSAVLQAARKQLPGF